MAPAKVVVEVGELLTLQAPWHPPDAVSQFITQAVKAWVWGKIEGKPGGGVGTVTVCCARRTDGPSSGGCTGVHTTPRINTHTSTLKLTRTCLPHFSDATYRILHGAVYILWKPKRPPIAVAVGLAGAKVKYNQSIGRHGGNHRRRKNCRASDRRKPPQSSRDGDIT